MKRLQAIENDLARAIPKTPKHHNITNVIKSLRWLKSISASITKLYLLPTMPFKPVNPLTFANYSPSKRPGLLTHHRIFLFHGLQSMLLQLFGTDSQKTSVSLLILLSRLLNSSLLRLYCPLLHLTHNGRPNSSSDPIPIPLLCHHTPMDIDCNHRDYSNT